MKVAIIETALKSAKAIDAHVRNAQVISSYLKCDLLFSNVPFDREEQYDIIIISYASFYFDFKKFEYLINNQKNCIFGWITNEYDLQPNSVFKKRIQFVISNFAESRYKKKWFGKYLMVNLNTLFDRRPNNHYNKPYQSIYYGTFRPDREEYFKKYLQEGMILSTSAKNHKRYKSLGCKCKYTDKFSWEIGVETLNLFKSSLYIEDKYTHTCYNHLANRFYEALFTNTAIFFDRSCKRTIELSEYPIDDYFVVNSLQELLAKTDEITREQVDHFISLNREKSSVEKQETLESIKKFLESL